MDINRDGHTEKLPLYIGNETVRGKVLLKVPAGKRIEHGGVKIELLGQIGTLACNVAIVLFVLFFRNTPRLHHMFPFLSTADNTKNARNVL